MGLHAGLHDNDLLPFSAFTCLVRCSIGLVYLTYRCSKRQLLNRPLKLARTPAINNNAQVGLVGILVFRESYPYFLDPNYMSTTLVTLTRYIQPHM